MWGRSEGSAAGCIRNEMLCPRSYPRNDFMNSESNRVTDIGTILVRDDLNTLDVTGRLENLTKHVLGDPRIQPTNIQGSFVRFRGGATRDVAWSTAGRRHDIGAHRRANGRRDRVRILRDDDGRKRWWRHVLLLALVASIVARGPRDGWRRHSSRSGSRISHGSKALRRMKLSQGGAGGQNAQMEETGAERLADVTGRRHGRKTRQVADEGCVGGDEVVSEAAKKDATRPWTGQPSGLERGQGKGRGNKEREGAEDRKRNPTPD
jgi:hypothetical protein